MPKLRQCVSCGSTTMLPHARRYCPTCRSIKRKNYHMEPERRSQNNTARKARRAASKGTLVKLPCFCGNPNVQGHHPDYTKPLEVIWLCARHHVQLHSILRNGDSKERVQILNRLSELEARKMKELKLRAED
jgi:hypothetical protein